MVPLDVADDVAGSYELSLGRATNECQLDGFADGAGLMEARLVITQNDTDASATLSGEDDAAWFDTWVGAHEFEGTVKSNHVVLTSTGKASLEHEGCEFTLVATIDAHLNGDVLEGTIGYVPEVTSGTDCSALAACENEQLFSSVPSSE
jgi:hypothetical protein